MHEWIIIDLKDPYTLKCTRCKAVEPYPFGKSVDIGLREMKEFSKIHKKCKSRDSLTRSAAPCVAGIKP